MRYLFIAAVFYSVLCVSQDNPQMKALNACVNYANEAADRANGIVKSVIEVYPSIEKKASWPKYTCPNQVEEYFYSQATIRLKSFQTPAFNKLKQSVDALRKADQQLDKSCKALDTYYKLEDFKSDNFQKAMELINDLKNDVQFFKNASAELSRSLESAEKALGPSPIVIYQQASDRMRVVLAKEFQLLSEWKINLNDKIHTGWPYDKVNTSIAEDENLLLNLKSKTPDLKYPASSMWSHFQESLSTIIDLKKTAIDDYNFEAKKNDRHANNVYLDLINYYNGTLVADYNTFIDFSSRDGFAGLSALKYVSSFEIRNQAMEINMNVAEFIDTPHVNLLVKKQTSSITPVAFKSLSAYVEFINETWRQTNYMQLVLRNFTSSANYFKGVASFEKRAPMNFEYADFKIPISFYNDAIRASAPLPAEYSRNLNQQAETIVSILKEMDRLSASIENEVKNKKYEADHLANIFKILERQNVLFKLWDEKKEALYNDLGLVYSSFAVASPESSWEKSGKILRALADEDHDILFKLRSYYGGDTTTHISTSKLDELIRETISNEFQNMNGIKKYGRNNGLCPYTPYEDVPETSRRFSEATKKLKPAGQRSGYDHPYHQFVYLYNEIVDDYNKFCELSTTVPHLKTIKQPEIYYPVGSTTVNREPIKKVEPEIKNVSKADDVKPVDQPKIAASVEVAPRNLHDTVFITKRDTVYLPTPTEDNRSMEGYAINNLFLLLDVSGSMNQSDKLPLLKQSMLDLISMMRTEDRITVVAFASKPKIALKQSSFKDEQKIRKAVSDLSSSGKTDVNAALRFVYKLADENYLRGGSNRIVLATDGDFSIDEEVLNVIQKFSEQDIFLSVFDFGKGMNASKNLARLAAIGKGNFESISRANVDQKLIREVKAKKNK
jgi:Ca-activated chloride channel family protein